jgi:hypothetical protein
MGSVTEPICRALIWIRSMEFLYDGGRFCTSVESFWTVLMSSFPDLIISRFSSVWEPVLEEPVMVGTPLLAAQSLVGSEHDQWVDFDCRC